MATIGRGTSASPFPIELKELHAPQLLISPEASPEVAREHFGDLLLPVPTMGRRSHSSSSRAWRHLSPSYYLKRPARLALLFLGFVAVTFAVWDRLSLVRDYEAEISRLDEEVDRLHDQLRKAGIYLSEDANIGHIVKKHHLDVDPVNNARRESVKEAMLHAWNSYVKYAWGQDELQPQSKNGVNSFGGLGATLVDSLDTLYIMGLKDEFQKARDWVAESLTFDKDYEASVFETTIRVVGGLLSAYDLSSDKIFVEKARDIADRLLPAWDTSSGIPYNRINLAQGEASNPRWNGLRVFLPEHTIVKQWQWRQGNSANGVISY